MCYCSNSSLFYPQNISVMPIRLRGSHSPNMERIEVHYAGTWGSVHASGWDIKDATVACRQLGYHSASLSCKPSREASIKRVGEKGTLGSFLPLPLPLSLLSLPSLSCFPSTSSPFLCLPRCPVPVRRFPRPSWSMHFGGLGTGQPASYATPICRQTQPCRWLYNISYETDHLK